MARQHSFRYRHLTKKYRYETGTRGENYYLRDKALAKLNFFSYSEYLRSPLWKAIRSAKLAVNPFCELCQKKPATAVHHQKYSVETLTGRRQNNLISMCHGCHNKAEFFITPGGQKIKRSLLQVRRYVKKRLKFNSRKTSASGNTVST